MTTLRRHALPPMAQRYRRPDWVRRLNAMADAAGSAGAVVPLQAGELLDRALETEPGAGRFGDLGDGDWEGRFRALVDAINAADLTVVGRLMTREELLRCLRTRLQLGELRRRKPAVADEPIDAPVVVTGPARSGTTILFELLALDPRFRSPVAADVLHPALAADSDDARKLAMTEPEQELWSDVQPEFAAMHELRSDLPVECITICAPSFAGSHWSMVLDDPGDWRPDPDADFAVHRAVLQAAQLGRPPKRWLLKTPAYLFLLDDLLRHYPDASVVFTHRDPARTMPSTVSTAAMIRWLRSDSVDIETLSLLVGAMFGDGLNRLAARQRAGTLPERSGHVRFTDAMADPVAAIRAAYDAMGLDLLDEHAAAVRDYLSTKPRGKHGVHDYTAAEWGFDVTDLRSNLADYLATFDVALED